MHGNTRFGVTMRVAPQGMVTPVLALPCACLGALSDDSRKD